MPQRTSPGPMFDEAVSFATEAHEGQQRKSSGAPYVTHPIRVAKRLRDAGVETESVLAAAVLHDTVEDTPATLRDIADRFGPDVRDLVAWLTQDKPGGQTRRMYTETFLKADPRACLIKVADRLDNMLDWEDIDPEYLPVYAAEGLLLLGLIHRNKRIGRLTPAQGAALRLLSRELNDVCADALWGARGD